VISVGFELSAPSVLCWIEALDCFFRTVMCPTFVLASIIVVFMFLPFAVLGSVNTLSFQRFHMFKLAGSLLYAKQNNLHYFMVEI
jgi:hypothetical protein